MHRGRSGAIQSDKTPVGAGADAPQVPVPNTPHERHPVLDHHLWGSKDLPTYRQLLTEKYRNVIAFRLPAAPRDVPMIAE